MWKKIKNIFIIIGSALVVVALTIVCFFVCGRNSDRSGSDGASERDRAIQDGIRECEERTGRIEEGIERAESSAGRCEEHLRRAEDILRNAIRRSKETEGAV